MTLLPGQQHSRDLDPMCTLRPARGLAVSWSWILFSLLHWSYDLVAVALLSASTVTYNDGDRMPLNGASSLGSASCQEAPV